MLAPPLMVGKGMDPIVFLSPSPQFKDGLVENSVYPFHAIACHIWGCIYIILHNCHSFSYIFPPGKSGAEAWATRCQVPRPSSSCCRRCGGWRQIFGLRWGLMTGMGILRCDCKSPRSCAGNIIYIVTEYIYIIYILYSIYIYGNDI